LPAGAALGAADKVVTGAVSLDSAKATRWALRYCLFGAATVTSPRPPSRKPTSPTPPGSERPGRYRQGHRFDRQRRSGLGATQNRLTTTVDNLQNIQKNSTAARPVRDVDFASETAELTKQQTLQQASTAILSQANQLPSSVLKLLQ
jgi:flagellin